MDGIRRGTFRYLILHVLSEGPMHGYGIMQRVQELFGGLYTPSPGIVYPTLQLLEDLGYVRSSRRGRRRVYSLTSEGKRVLEEHRAEVEEILALGRGFARFVEELGGSRLIGLLKRLFTEIPHMDADKRERLRRAVERFLAELTEVLGNAGGKSGGSD